MRDKKEYNRILHNNKNTKGDVLNTKKCDENNTEQKF
jgi:hypothetical protein